MGRRKQPKAAPRQGTVYVRGTGAFTADNVRAVLNAARLEPRKPPHWVAEALNEATADYFAAFALARTRGQAHDGCCRPGLGHVDGGSVRANLHRSVARPALGGLAVFPFCGSCPAHRNRSQSDRRRYG